MSNSTLFSKATRALLVLTAGLLPAALPAQRSARGDDERDKIELQNGREIRGRVVQRYDTEEVLLVQGGKRVRVEPKKIKSMRTVRDELRAFFEYRDALDLDEAANHWDLSKWADGRALHALARTEAYATLARDPDHVEANEYVGNRKKGKRWMWRYDDRWMSREKFDERTSDIGHAFELESETFAIETNAGLKKATDALLDLERLYVWWHDEFGKELQLDEIIKPMRVKAWAKAEKFPAWSSDKIPYYVPNPYQDQSFVFFDEGRNRPTGLFSVGSQHLLYHALARRADPGNQQNRFCDWLELGIGEWADSCFRGPAGQAEPGLPDKNREQAALAILGDRYSLKNMLHLTLRDHFYSTGSLRRSGRTDARVHWAAAHMFTAFLLDEEANPGIRPKLLEYLRLALAEGKGDSSSAFDDAIGRRIEEFEKPWAEWLQARAGELVRPGR